MILSNLITHKQGIIENILEGQTRIVKALFTTPSSSNSFTKVRIVYDASAKANRSGKCVNDGLYRGSITLSDLCGALLRPSHLPYCPFG